MNELKKWLSSVRNRIPSNSRYKAPMNITALIAFERQTAVGQKLGANC